MMMRTTLKWTAGDQPHVISNEVKNPQKVEELVLKLHFIIIQKVAVSRFFSGAQNHAYHAFEGLYSNFLFT
jgi:hypothetical protein